MKRINEAIAEKASSFTKGQHLLARFISEHCDKAAFMSSFDLAAVTGVSQSTVIRFASALGYQGYGDFQDALQLELKYRLTTLERFELVEENSSNDAEMLNTIAMHDALNIKKNLSSAFKTEKKSSSECRSFKSDRNSLRFDRNSFERTMRHSLRYIKISRAVYNRI